MDEIRLPKVGDWVTRSDLQRYWPDMFFQVVDVTLMNDRFSGGVVMIDQGGNSVGYDYLCHISVGERWIFKKPNKGGFAKWITASK
jgi:hypothetical protein